MQSTSKVKRPILISVLLTLLILIFPVLSGVIITVLNLNEILSTLVQAIMFFLAFAIACLISKKIGGIKAVGLQKPDFSAFKKCIWFIPLVLTECIVCFAGLNRTISPLLYMCTLVLL